MDQPNSFEPTGSPRKARSPEIQATAPLPDASPPSWGIQEGASEPPRDFDRSTALDGCAFAAPLRVPVIACILAVWTIAAACFFLIESETWAHACFAISSIPAFFATIWRFFLWRRFRVRFTENGVETFGPHEILAYHEIMEVYAPDRLSSPGSFDIYLLHAYGFVCIPKTIRASSIAIFEFLLSQELAERDNPAVPSELQRYFNQVKHAHGEANVYVYRSRLSLKNQEPSRTREYVAGYMFAGGFAIMMIIGITPICLTGNDNHMKDAPIYVMVPFFVFTVILLLGAIGYVIFHFLRWLAEAHASLQSLFGLQTESVVIVSPAGLAVLRGNKRIVANWEELRIGSTAGIALEDFGDTSAIVQVWKDDVRIRLRTGFHWPVRHVTERIRKYLERSDS